MAQVAGTSAAFGLSGGSVLASAVCRAVQDGVSLWAVRAWWASLKVRACLGDPASGGGARMQAWRVKGDRLQTGDS